jgi:hypothetical protein
MADKALILTAVAPEGKTLLVTNSNSRQLEAANTGDLP